MAALTFDTLKFASRLKEAGVPEKQAEAEAAALADVFEAQKDELVTKSYLDVRLEQMKADVREMDARINGRLNLLTWMIAIVILTTVVPALKSLFS